MYVSGLIVCWYSARQESCDNLARPGHEIMTPEQSGRDSADTAVSVR